MILLHIETSTTVCSVALSKNGSCIFSCLNDEGMNHAALLSSFIHEALSCPELKTGKPDAVVVSSGPGSYTGLRIGVSTAKGLCYGFDIPMIAVNSLEVLTDTLKSTVSVNPDALFCPMIDARRMEVYSAIYDIQGNFHKEVSSDIIDTDSYKNILDHNSVYFFGNGSDKCKTALTHPNAIFVDHIVPKAEHMIQAGERAYLQQNFADTAYFEPYYLKEFQATTPKKNLF